MFLKVSQIVPTSVYTYSNLFFKMTKNHQSFLATFMSKFVVKNFQKSPNLVTLLRLGMQKSLGQKWTEIYAFLMMTMMLGNNSPKCFKSSCLLACQCDTALWKRRKRSPQCLSLSLSLSLSSIVFLNHISLTHTKGPLDGDQCDQIGRFFKVLGYKFSSKSSLNVTFWALLKASLFM